MKLYSYLLVLIISLAYSAGAFAQHLIVAADLWCPYSCTPNTQKPGYVVELLDKILAAHGHKIHYKLAPWTRVLLDTSEGKIDGAIGATPEQAQDYDLIIGHEPIGSYGVCLFVATNNPLRYKTINDLNALKKVGIVSGYTYINDMGEWINRPENSTKIDVISGQNTPLRSAKKLLLHHIDAFIEDGSVMAYTLTHAKLEKQIISAGCQDSTPIYVAFSPTLKNVDVIINQFDEGLVEMRKTGELKKLLETYDVVDWK